MSSPSTLSYNGGATLRGRDPDANLSKYSPLSEPKSRRSEQCSLSKSREESNTESNYDSNPDSFSANKSTGVSPYPLPRSYKYNRFSNFNQSEVEYQERHQYHQYQPSGYLVPNIPEAPAQVPQFDIRHPNHRSPVMDLNLSYPVSYMPTMIVPPSYPPEMQPRIYQYGMNLVSYYPVPYPVYTNMPQMSNNSSMDYMYQQKDELDMLYNLPVPKMDMQYSMPIPTNNMVAPPTIEYASFVSTSSGMSTTVSDVADDKKNCNDNLEFDSNTVKSSSNNCTKAKTKNLTKIELTKRRVRSICSAKLLLNRDHLKHSQGSDAPVESVVVYWMSRELRTIHNHSLSHAQAVAIENGVPLVVYFSPIHCPQPNRRQADWRIRGIIDVQVELEKCNITFVSEVEREWPVLKCLLKNFDVIHLITDAYPLNPMVEFRKEIREFLPLTTNFDEVDAHNVVPIWIASKKRETRAYDFRQKLRAAMNNFKLYHLPLELGEHPHAFRGLHFLTPFKYSHLNSSRAVMSLLSLNIPQLQIDEEVPPCDWAEPGQREGLRAINRWCSSKINGYAKFRNDPHMQAVSHLSPYLNYGFISAQYVLCKIEQATTTKQADKQRYKNEILTWKELSDNFSYYDKNYDKVQAFPSWATKSYAEKCNEPREVIYTREELENFKTSEPLWNACQKELAMFGKIHTTLRLYWAKKLIEWSEDPESALNLCNHLNDKWSLDGCDPIGYSSTSWSIGGTLDRPFPNRPLYGKIRYLTCKSMEKKFDVKRWCEKVDFAWKAYNQPGRIDAESGTSYKFLYKPDDLTRMNFLMERKEWRNVAREYKSANPTSSDDDECFPPQ